MVKHDPPSTVGGWVSLWPMPLGIEFPGLIIGVVPPTPKRAVGPQDTISTDADPGRCTYTRFSEDLFGSFSLSRVALGVDLERCRVACARCTIVYVLYQYEVCLPSLGGNVAA